MATETVLITGASSGIGLELAHCFARDKSNLILVARREERLRELADELRSRHGVHVRIMAKDLAQASAPKEIEEELSRDGTAVDVLVNNAGFGARGTVAELPLERQMEMLQVNVAALTELTRRFLPAMIERRRGGVLNVASTAAFQAGPWMTVYYASKAYVMSFSEGIAEELAGTGVMMSCLCPGPTETEFKAAANMESAKLFRLGSMSAEEVALAGYEGFRRGKVLVIPGMQNKVGVFSVRFAPRAIVRKIIKSLQGV